MNNDEIAEHLIQQIKQGAGRWEMPWHKGLPEPFNGVTGKKFRGQNAVILWAESLRRGYSSSEWATLRQWNKAGGRIKRGAKGVKVLRPRIINQADVFGGNSENTQGFRFYHVFNYQEVNGVDHEHPDLFSDVGKFENSNEEAEVIVESSGAVIKYGYDRAFYKPFEDVIYMPNRIFFKATGDATAEENFYATIIHELIHWTKAEKRCDRSYELGNSGDSYAFEELVAELGAAILTTRLHQLPFPRRQHAAYLDSWLRFLSDDFSLFYKATRLAQDACDWLCKKAGLVDYLSIVDDELKDFLDEKPGVEKKPACVEGELILWSPAGSGFIRTAMVGIKCGGCGENFVVTLMRYEVGSFCDICEVFNKVKINW